MQFLSDFASEPLRTWKTLYEKLLPYGERLISRDKKLYTGRIYLLEEIHNLFTPDTFTDDKLSGEYILGFFAQRQALSSSTAIELQEPDLVKSCVSRDYLYGRLLAITQIIEEKALYLVGKERATNAQRYMRAFSVKPAATFEWILKKVGVYEKRFKANFLTDFYNSLQEEIVKIKDSLGGSKSDISILSGLYLEGLQKMTNILSLYSRCFGRHSSPRPSKYQSATLLLDYLVSPTG
jgi:hypothetical protein